MRQMTQTQFCLSAMIEETYAQTLLALPRVAKACNSDQLTRLSRYGSLKTWASELDLGKAAKLLEATLAEEKKTNATLTTIAENDINQHPLDFRTASAVR